MFEFTAEEAHLISQILETDLVDLSVELDIAVPEVIERLPLVASIFASLADHAGIHGLPFSTYDAMDLEELPSSQRTALAQACGTPPTVKALMKQGTKAYKVLAKRGFRSQIPLLLPSFLSPFCRWLEHQR
jgi:hypothetical protein